jgi:hypothetical protein
MQSSTVVIYVIWFPTVNTLNISIHRVTEYFKSDVEVGSVLFTFSAGLTFI